MLRLCGESSRSYPGRSARHAVSAAMGAGLRTISKGMEKPPNPKGILAARYPGMVDVTGQKSAEAIATECLM